MTTLRMAKMASIAAVFGFLCVSCSSGVRRGNSEAASAQPRAEVESVQVREADGKVTVAVETTRKIAYTVYQQEDPLRVVLELPQTSTGEFDRNIPVNRGTLGFVKPVSTGEGDSHLEFFLTGPSTYDIEGDGRTVKLTISPAAAAVLEEEPPGAPAAAVAPALRQEAIESSPLPEMNSTPIPEEEVALEMAFAAAPAPEDMPAAAEFVTAIKVRNDPGGTLAMIKGDGALQYEYFLVEGKSLVIDVFGAGNKIWPTVHKVDDDYIEQIRIGEHFQPDKKVRIVFDLKSPGDYEVRKGRSQITVAFGSPEKPPAEEAEVSSGPVNVVSEVYFRPLYGKSRIEIHTTGTPDFKVVDSEDPHRLIVEVHNARIEPAAQKTLDLSRLERAVDRITAFHYQKDEGDIVRVVGQMRLAAPFKVAASGSSVIVEINDSEASPIQAPPAEVAEEAEEAEEAMAAAPAEEGAAAEAPVSGKQAFRQAMGLEGGPKVYTGKKLSLDFIDADVNDILRLIADVSGLNFVAGPEVQGKVTIRLADVPWDQALDIILKTNVPPLAQIQESETIFRITTLAKLEEEAEARRRAAETQMKNEEAEKKLEPLVTQRFQISYADINDIQEVVRQFTSDRVDADGLLAIDERTNTVIVRDLQENVDEIARTIEALDSPTPAVVVEARVVEVTDVATEQLGVQWNLNFTADQAHGNALPFEFPNSVGMTGGVGDAPTNYMVNLPVADPAGGIGLSFGHIANTLSLDLRLQALEQMGEVKILTSPRVLVVQNQQATINLGQQLPIPSTDAEGNRTVIFQDVGIRLVVTPQVTNDKRVFMDIEIEKSSRGENVPTTEGVMFSINSRRAQTQVLIRDGETSVIGGLTVEETSETEVGVPGFSKIPGLGWLFKSKDNQGRRDEMMIFLTPRIIDVM